MLTAAADAMNAGRAHHIITSIIIEQGAANCQLMMM
jgi:hypothetical protein